jgi:hypothetical protein
VLLVGVRAGAERVGLAVLFNSFEYCVLLVPGLHGEFFLVWLPLLLLLFGFGLL